MDSEEIAVNAEVVAQPPRRIDASLIVRESPGVARVVATGYLRTVEWSVRGSFGAGRYLLRRAAKGDSPLRIAQDVAIEMRGAAREFLGLEDGSPPIPLAAPAKAATGEELRARGAELLRRSADVRFDEDMHPAYERILSELSPDEARILRYLVLHGPQPTVDVRTNRPLGIGSELVAAGLSMIGELAGCRNVDRTRAYQNNLFRLGLLWFSRESVDPQRYQLVEAQPAVVEALRRAGRAPKTVHRSIHLTPFGIDFCSTCLPVGQVDYTAHAALEHNPVEGPE